MTNRSSAKRHGGHQINQRRKKTTLSTRTNKESARERREKLKAKGLNC